MMRARYGVVALTAALAVACAIKPPASVTMPTAITFGLAGQFDIPPQTLTLSGTDTYFGGISGLAPVDGNGAMLAISDDRTRSRVYKLRLTGDGAAFKIASLDEISLQLAAPSPEKLDPEGIALVDGTRMFISSEGLGSEEPRVPPAVVEYTLDGIPMRQLTVPDRFVPNPTGPLVKGVRENYGFESLTVTPDGRRLFTASETALAQDGETATFTSGTTARILEFVREGDTFRAAREFAYPLEPADRPDFPPGMVVKGLVELLALGESELLALERTWVAAADGAGAGANYARVYRVSLSDASDVSQWESLRQATGVVPVTKQLVLDLRTLPGLRPELAQLDNFEALAFGPPRAGGQRTLVVASDDNFNRTQRSWFLLLSVK